MKVELLEQCHPMRDGETLARYRALCEGGELWRKKLDYWLPEHEMEPGTMWAERKKLAYYHNYAGGICSMFAAYLFGEEPRLSGLDKPFWQEFADNADQAGTSLASFWRQVFLDAEWGRDAWVWVNSKKSEFAAANRAEEEKLGLLDRYLVPLTADEVLDWGEDDTGNPIWCMFRQKVSQRKGPTEERKDRWVWTAVTTTTITRWEWVATKDQKTPNPKDEAREIESFDHKMGEFPMVRVRLSEALWPMRHLHDPSVAHIRARHDLMWALYRTAHAMPVIMREWEQGDEVIGSGFYIKLGPKDKFEWAEPPGTTYGILAEDVERLKDEIFRVVNQMAAAVDASASQARASGDSKMADWQATDIVTGAYAEIIGSAILEAARIIARSRGEDAAKLTLEGLDGWQTDSLETFLANAAQALDASQMSPTFRKTLAKIEAIRLLGNSASQEDLQKMIDEIDTWQEPTDPWLPEGTDADPDDPGRTRPPGRGTPKTGEGGGADGSSGSD